MISKERKSYHPQKNALFNISSLADLLHRSKSIYLKDSKYSKISFLKNQVSNLIKQEKKYLFQLIKKYKLAVKKNLIYKKDKLLLEVEAKVSKEAVNKLFALA